MSKSPKMIAALVMVAAAAATACGSAQLPREIDLANGEVVRLGAKLPVSVPVAPVDQPGLERFQEISNAALVGGFADAERLYVELDAEGQVQAILVLFPAADYSTTTFVARWLETWGETENTTRAHGNEGSVTAATWTDADTRVQATFELLGDQDGSFPVNGSPSRRPEGVMTPRASVWLTSR